MVKDMEKHIDRVLALVKSDQAVKTNADSQRCEVNPADTSDVELMLIRVRLSL